MRHDAAAKTGWRDAAGGETFNPGRSIHAFPEVEMTSMGALWLPIVLSSVLVFVVSSVIHMALPWHKSDYPRVPDEDRLREALRPLAIPPGDYMIPRPTSMAEMKSPAFAEKMVAGPVMVVTV